MFKNEWDVGLGQVLVLYTSDDTGAEVDAVSLHEEVAADARQYAQRGLRIASMSPSPLRHAQAFMARQGSGYESKLCITAVYVGEHSSGGKAVR